MPERRLILVGLLDRFLDGRDRPVLVGGGLVELYTSGGYTTGDVDLVGSRRAVAELLRDAGFEEEGRHLFREDLGLVVEVPGRYLRDTEEVVEVMVDDLTLLVLRVEDVLVDRLLAAKFWRSPTDWEQAIILFSAHEAQLDRDALRTKAEANDVLDALADLERTVAEASGA